MAAVQHGVPGEWARVKGTVLSLWPLFLCFTLLGAFCAAAILGRYPFVFAMALFVSIVAVAFTWRKGMRRVESFFKGARGEERVARLLAGLPDGYHVFNDFVAGSCHVDHVVVGPAGVFCVETKNWMAPVTVEDRCILVGGRLPSRAPDAQVSMEVDAVASTLRRSGWDGNVSGIVCFASDTLVATAGSVNGMKLVNANSLVSAIVSLPGKLSPSDTERLAGLMELGK